MVRKPKKNLLAWQSVQQLQHARAPGGAQLSGDKGKPVAGLCRDILQHVACEVVFGEIHLAEDGFHHRGCSQEPVIAARMHTIKPVGHILRAHQLDHGDFGASSEGEHLGLMDKGIHARVHIAKIDTGHSQGTFDKIGKGLLNELPIGLRAPQKGHIAP